MKWLPAPNSDEHVLCDDSGHASEYRVRRDPVSCVYNAYDGQLWLHRSIAIYPCQRVCEERYAAERAGDISRRVRRGRYSNRGAA